MPLQQLLITNIFIFWFLKTASALFSNKEDMNITISIWILILWVIIAIVGIIVIAKEIADVCRFFQDPDKFIENYSQMYKDRIELLKELRNRL